MERCRAGWLLVRRDSVRINVGLSVASSDLMPAR